MKMGLLFKIIVLEYFLIGYISNMNLQHFHFPNPIHGKSPFVFFVRQLMNQLTGSRLRSLYILPSSFFKIKL